MQTVNILGTKRTLNLWGKANLLLTVLESQDLLHNCHIYWSEARGVYEINGINVGVTEEEVTTSIWLMVESYAVEGHIDFRDNATIAQRNQEEHTA